VAGPNGSGKSSIVSSTKIVKNHGENIINPDNYARNIVDIKNEKARYIFAMNLCEALRNNLLEVRAVFGFETIASTEEKIDFLKKAAAKGYRIDVLFVSLESPELCCQRIQKRVERGGHDVERSKVFSRYEKAMNYLKEYIRIADAASVYDNSGGSPVLVFSKDGERMEILKEPSEIPWVEKYIHSFYKDAEKTL
jgi:predicted ABC-type ATPase